MPCFNVHQEAIENILQQGDGEYFYGYWTILIVTVMSIYTSVLAFEYNMLSFVAPCAVADFFPNISATAAAYYEVWFQETITQPQLPKFNLLTRLLPNLQRKSNTQASLWSAFGFGNSFGNAWPRMSVQIQNQTMSHKHARARVNSCIFELFHQCKFLRETEMIFQCLCVCVCV